MDLPIVITLGVIAAIVWTLLVLRSRRKQKNEVSWQGYELYAVAISEIEVTGMGETYVDTHTHVAVYAVRAESKEKAISMVSESLGKQGEKARVIVAIELPRDWKEEIYYGHTASASLPSPSA